MLSGKYLAVADIVGRICLCAYFLFIMLNRVLVARLLLLKDELAFADVVHLATEVTTILFLGMVCAVTVTRLRPIRSADGIEPYVTAMAGTFLLGLIAYLPEPVDSSLPLRLVALTFMTAGLLASVYVVVWLGRSFSIMPEARKLVVKGPYSIVRHPLYLTEELVMIGIVILSLSPWSVLLGIIQWCLQLRRMANEERVLKAAFPDYEEYARSVPRIIPSVRIKTASRQQLEQMPEPEA